VIGYISYNVWAQSLSMSRQKEKDDPVNNEDEEEEKEENKREGSEDEEEEDKHETSSVEENPEDCPMSRVTFFTFSAYVIVLNASLSILHCAVNRGVGFHILLPLDSTIV